uniref:lysophospholipid acyltransferase 2-like n=1 Tax=Styela clava TaxID=7725 RepID=UPI001939D036|nr:lysophospholipid acyltransferase 2-like [Styela clava]
MGHSAISFGVSHVSEITGLRTEQISFVVCILMSFIVAYIFRHKIHHTNTNTRLLISGCFGLWLLYFAWGWNVITSVTDTVVTYLLLKYLNPKYAYKVTFVFSMVFLSTIHFRRLISFNSEGGRTSTDFTGPNMILTQRITSIAFNIHDGLHKNPKDLSEDQKKYAVKKFPSFLEYFSYCFMFTSVLAGPFVFYQDYISFINGTNYKLKDDEKPSNVHPPYLASALKKLIFGIIMAAFFIYGCSAFPYLRNTDVEYMQNTGWIEKLIFLQMSLFFARTKYYVAWFLADSVCNTAGLGFNGYDEKNGKPRWNKFSNIDFFGIEMATSFKLYIDNWNMMTVKWLRRVCYDRAPSAYRTQLTFLLSAMWHGFFPGYYMTFFSGHIITLTQRKFRSTIRPLFQTSENLKVIYGIFTWFATQLAISYIVIPFVTLEFEASFRFYTSCYFCGHIFCFVLIFLLPKSRRKGREELNGHTESVGINGKLKKNPYLDNLNGHVWREMGEGLATDTNNIRDGLHHR